MLLEVRDGRVARFAPARLVRRYDSDAAVIAPMTVSTSSAR